MKLFIRKVKILEKKEKIEHIGLMGKRKRMGKLTETMKSPQGAK